jgi:hypothetical protein
MSTTTVAAAAAAAEATMMSEMAAGRSAAPARSHSVDGRKVRSSFARPWLHFAPLVEAVVVAVVDAAAAQIIKWGRDASCAHARPAQTSGRVANTIG